MKARILLIVALAVVLLTVGGISAAPATADEAVVPFKASYVTYPKQVDFDPVNGIVTLEIPAEGKGTHLGASTFYSDSWVQVYVSPRIQTGEITFTAANGAQLVGFFEGIAVHSGTVVEFQGEFTITGGTGRLEGVTGTGVYCGMADMAVGQGTITFDGTLTK